MSNSVVESDCVPDIKTVEELVLCDEQHVCDKVAGNKIFVALGVLSGVTRYFVLHVLV